MRHCHKLDGSSDQAGGASQRRPAIRLRERCEGFRTRRTKFGERGSQDAAVGLAQLPDPALEDAVVEREDLEADEGGSGQPARRQIRDQVIARHRV